MALAIPNLQQIRQDSPLVGRAFDKIGQWISNVNLYNGLDITGNPSTPPTINSLDVTQANGVYHAVITDNGDIYRPVNYFVHYSTDSTFAPQNTHVVDLGSSRTQRLPLFPPQNQPVYFRAFSQYKNGGPASTPVNHGGTTPTGIASTSTIAGPSFPTSTGSGTGTGNGAGSNYYRSSTGRAPTIGSKSG